MYAILLAALVGQIGADGLTIDPNLAANATTWRWVNHDGKAVLGWGHLNGQGQFVADPNCPPPPLHPGATPKPPANEPPAVESLPEFATNGVAVDKLDDGLTLRASDQTTAVEARTALEATGGPLDRIKLPKLSPTIGPDLSKIALHAIAFGLFGVAGVVFLRSLQPR